MNHLLELHEIYVKDLVKVRESFQEEKENIYYVMSTFCQLYEKEKELHKKLQEIEREMVSEFNQELNNDR